MSLASWAVTLQFAVVYSIFALSLYAPLAAGVLSVASLSSAAASAFTFAWLTEHHPLPGVVYLLLGVVLGGALALILSFILVRLTSHFQAMATIALLLVTGVVILNAPSLTGGVSGRTVPSLFGWPYLLGSLAVCGWVFARVRRSRLGLASAVIREDPLVGGALGIDPRSSERLGLVLGGATGGLAGVLLASLLQYIDPNTFYLNLAFVSLASVVLGSAYHWQGAIVGALVFTLLPHLLTVYFPPSTNQVVNGSIIIAVMIFVPGGLYDVRRVVGWAAGQRPVRAGGETAAVIAGATATETISPDRPPEASAPASAEARPRAEESPVRVAATVPAQDLAVHATHVSRAFGGVQAVNDVTIEVPTGSIFGILGPNGAGKTTMINLLSGVFASDAGTIEVLGHDVTRSPSYRIARLGLARTYQNIRLSPGLSVLETIISGAFTRGSSGLASVVLALPSERRERQAFAAEARELMDVVGLSTPPDRLAQALSYGEQRRVEIARALASKPKVLLLDEPTAGMNARESSALGDLMRELVGRGITIILVEHNIKLVVEYCDIAVVMHSGSVLARGRARGVPRTR